MKNETNEEVKEGKDYGYSNNKVPTFNLILKVFQFVDQEGRKCERMNFSLSQIEIVMDRPSVCYAIRRASLLNDPSSDSSPYFSLLQSKSLFPILSIVNRVVDDGCAVE
jgi:hypothetical protein